MIELGLFFKVCEYLCKGLWYVKNALIFNLVLYVIYVFVFTWIILSMFCVSWNKNCMVTIDVHVELMLILRRQFLILLCWALICCKSWIEWLWVIPSLYVEGCCEVLLWSVNRDDFMVLVLFVGLLVLSLILYIYLDVI